MHASIANCRLELQIGDITLQTADAIVNAANQHLAGGGGVDGAIHRRGGPEIIADTNRRYPHGCATGDAVISVAGNLAAQYVIHAVGPRWAGGNRGEAELLQSAYRRAFQLAIDHKCRSIALPASSTGAYAYPLRPASQVALSTTIESIRNHPSILERVNFVLFNDAAFQVFAAVLRDLLPASP
jgi:O-acetyl-ADP-ribose deacetylase